MKFDTLDTLPINNLQHINAHVSYLLTCDSQAKTDPEGYAESNIIAYYKEDGELMIVNGYNVEQRASLAKVIRKLAKDSIDKHTDRAIQKHLKMQLAYLEGLEDSNLNTEEGFMVMAKYIERYINAVEEEASANGEKTFIYVFHTHQDDMPHLHRFFKV